jgi:inorganic pyrophosphatase
LLNRLKHYFLTYKNLPDDASQKVHISSIYGAAEAKEVIQRSINDYNKVYEQ